MNALLTNRSNVGRLAGWIFGIFLVVIGVLNLFLVHPVPGIGYLIISFVYWPPVNEMVRRRFGVKIPLIVKIALGVIIFLFTFGVSDLGEMID